MNSNPIHNVNNFLYGFPMMFEKKERLKTFTRSRFMDMPISMRILPRKKSKKSKT